MTAAGLAETGAFVTAVESADEALAMLRQARFDVVVADIGMPAKDGYALMRELRSSGDREMARIPAVAVTAYTSQRDRTAALEAGYQAHLPKPVDLVGTGRDAVRARARLHHPARRTASTDVRACRAGTAGFPACTAAAR